MNAIINNACQVMKAEGFESFYHSLVKQTLEQMPMNYSDFANRTNRATLPLNSHNDALFYGVAYAMGHYRTFLDVLTHNLMIKEHDTVLNIVDYGCGQGIATLALLDFIASQQNPKNIHLNIHLIEPSQIALGNACYQILSLAQNLSFSVKITTQNCFLNQSTVPNFQNGADTLHLMSYILDVQTIQAQLKQITDQIRVLSGIQHIIASGINTSAGYNGFNLLSEYLIGYHQNIGRYQTHYRAYRVIQGRYENTMAKAIGFMISLNNDLSFNQVA